jgi:lysine-specific histone demethylase 1
VLVTAPLGVLKKGAISFNPPLPQAKQAAISRLGFGVLNKLVLLFPYAFWGPNLDLLAHVSDDAADSGLFYLLYAFQPHLAGSGAVLAALVSGRVAALCWFPMLCACSQYTV